MGSRVLDVLRKACTVTFFGYAWGSDDASWRDVEASRLYANRGASLYLCRSGSIDVFDAGGHTTVTAPDACLVPAGMVHVASCDAAANYLCVEIDVPAVIEVMPAGVLGEFRANRHDLRRPTVIRGLYDKDMRLLVRRLAYGLSEGDERRSFSLLGMVADLLVEIDRGLGLVRKGALDVSSVLAYMKDNLATASLAGVAEHFCCHPNSIANLLKRHCGTTFSEAMKTLRMELACSLLESGGASVQEVAAACGYKNMTHFYDVFRAWCGMTPGQFRERGARKAS